MTLAATPARAELKFLEVQQPGLQPEFNTLTPYGKATVVDAGERVAAAVQTNGEEESTGKQKKSPYPWRAVPPPEPDYRGAARDTVYFLAYQVLVIGVIYVLPESISTWTAEDKENYNFGTWKENVRNPHWDDDTFLINYVLHPYWGATYYVRGRERGLSRPQSFAFSAGLSFLYEFGMEALFEQPSYQDLIVTPVVGSLIGEFWFWGVRDRIKAKPGSLTWQDKTILVLTDPLGTASTLTDGWLGIDATVSLRIDDINQKTAVAANSVSSGTFPLYSQRIRTAAAWGLRLNVTW